MLVTVMIVTAVGLLFGAGALLLFRYQCQLRIDRQHEMEKVYAVRSALNYIRTCDANIGDSGKEFTYFTNSERSLGLFVKPVEPIFPVWTNESHFVMQREGDFRTPCPKQYDRKRDYEYGSTDTELGDYGIYQGLNSSLYGLAFGDTTATNTKWWVNIGMRGTGGWLQEDYGRRYYFRPLSFVEVGAGGTNDIVRLCIIRNLTNSFNAAGCRHGWPLSQRNERAIVFEIAPRQSSGNATNNAEMALYEYVHNGSFVEQIQLLRWSDRPSVGFMGMQLADDKATIFYIGNATINTIPDGGGYNFSETSASFSRRTYEYFSSPVVIGGIGYPGISTNSEGKVQAPELRAVFEVEAASDQRRGGANLDFLTNFKVTPAYQYDVFVEHPALVTNRATVAQKIGTYNRGQGLYYTVLTYDTHGTEHKGFRRDEREAERRAGR